MDLMFIRQVGTTLFTTAILQHTHNSDSVPGITAGQSAAYAPSHKTPAKPFEESY